MFNRDYENDLKKMAVFEQSDFKCLFIDDKVFYIFIKNRNAFLPPYIFYEKVDIDKIKNSLNNISFLWNRLWTMNNEENEKLKKIFISYDFKKTWGLTKNVLKYCNKIESLSPESDFLSYENITQTQIENFYTLYKNYFQWQDIIYKERDFFDFLLDTFRENTYMYNVYIWNSLVWSVICIKYLDGIVPMYWWYNRMFVEKGLKYYVNKNIIEYSSGTTDVHRVIFGSWIDPCSRSDSLLQFKQKFWDMYFVYKT